MSTAPGDGSSNSRFSATTDTPGRVLLCSRCATCEISSRVQHWREGETGLYQTLDGDCFPCEHWRDHHAATFRAVENKSGRARSGPVTAVRAP